MLQPHKALPRGWVIVRVNCFPSETRNSLDTENIASASESHQAQAVGIQLGTIYHIKPLQYVSNLGPEGSFIYVDGQVLPSIFLLLNDDLPVPHYEGRFVHNQTLFYCLGHHLFDQVLTSAPSVSMEGLWHRSRLSRSLPKTSEES